MKVLVVADKLGVGSSADGSERRGLSASERPIQPALTEEHVSCVTGNMPPLLISPVTQLNTFSSLGSAQSIKDKVSVRGRV